MNFLSGILIIGSASVILYFIFKKLAGKQNETKKSQETNLDDLNTQEFTLEQLSKFTGVDGGKVYISLKGHVFDVSASEFYKPGGSYAAFAGKDCSVALAKMSLDPQYLNCYQDTPLEQKETEVLQQWYDKLSAKYKFVGKIHENKKNM